jgi:hypothetical protein
LSEYDAYCRDDEPLPTSGEERTRVRQLFSEGEWSITERSYSVRMGISWGQPSVEWRQGRPEIVHLNCGDFDKKKCSGCGEKPPKSIINSYRMLTMRNP